MEQQKLPNSTLIIVLAIVSYVLCCFYGVGAILAIVAIILASGATKTYKLNPEMYTDYNTVKTGKIIAIIGLIINILFLLFIIWIISIVGWDALQDEELARERLEDFFNK